MSWVDNPNLPDEQVTAVAVSEQAEDVISALQRRGIHSIVIPSSERFAKPVASHPDMRCWLTGGAQGFCTDEVIQNQIRGIGIHLSRTNVQSFLWYPNDCSLNAARIGRFVFANPKCLCDEVKHAIEHLHLKLIPVKQGYAKCSIAIVSENAIITSDIGIADVAGSVGFDVLRLKPGNIRLAGYPYGFIGGTCGKLSAHILAFAGSLQMHPQAAEITQFLSDHNVIPVSLTKGMLQDIGGILPLQQQ